MDHPLVALLNSALETVDPLETPLGTARWWGSVGHRPALALASETKPRFDAGLSAALRALRADVAALIAGGSRVLRLPFRGDAADAILFELAQAACTAVADGTARRIRRCTGQACGRYFLDETKNGSRRWCSLRCMERARAPRRRTISR